MAMMEELKSLGVDVDEGMERVMGDADLYEMMLGMFLDSLRDNPVALEDFDGNDLDKLIKGIHTLKGITGNLGITPLFDGYTESLGLLRGNRPKEAKAVFARILPVQTDIVACINRNKNA